MSYLLTQKGSYKQNIYKSKSHESKTFYLSCKKTHFLDFVFCFVCYFDFMGFYFKFFSHPSRDLGRGELGRELGSVEITKTAFKAKYCYFLSVYFS